MSLPALLSQPLLVLDVCSVALCWIELRDLAGTGVERAFGGVEMGRVNRVVVLTAEAADNGRSTHCVALHRASPFEWVLCEVHCSTEDTRDEQYRRSYDEHIKRFCEQHADAVEY